MTDLNDFLLDDVEPSPRWIIEEEEADDNIYDSLMSEMMLATPSESDNIFTAPKHGGAKVEKRIIETFPPEPIGNIDESITTGDMLMLVYAEMKRKGMAGHHIAGLNSFYGFGIKQIITKIFSVEIRMKNERQDTDEDKEIDEIACSVKFTDVSLEKPQSNKYFDSSKTKPMYPYDARRNNLTYSSQLSISAEIEATAYFRNGKSLVRTDKITNHRTAKIPCGLGTEMCHTSNASMEFLKSIKEDPYACGGDFIINGQSWLINNLETKTNNTFHVYKNMYGNEIARGEFLSKPGDAFENSYQVILRYLTSGGITIEITTNKYEKFEMPFYLIYRVLGMTRDRDIMEYIVYNYESKDLITRQLYNNVLGAFDAEYTLFKNLKKTTEPSVIRDEIAREIMEKARANINEAKKDINVAKYINSNILSIIDKYIFPHIGTGIEHRISKLLFFGRLINRLLCVVNGVIEQTDRDSLEFKRVLSAGPSLGKTLKTSFNFSVVQQIKKRLIKNFKETPFSRIHLAESVRGSIDSESLEKMLVQAIVRGEKVIKTNKNEITSHISSEVIYHKNDLNVKSALNAINTPTSSANKQNDRSDRMRRVHKTYVGYIDVSQTSEGAGVGTHKQMCSMASLTGASSSFLLKETLLRDPDIIALNDVKISEIDTRQLAFVLVNGHWIGCCEDSCVIAARYRELRRRGVDINRNTTIVWEPSVREVLFWTDMGRLSRPLVIVYNNLSEYVVARRAGKSVKFQQWIKLTKQHIIGLRTGKITMDALCEARVIEYFSPEEQKNTYLAQNINKLRTDANNVFHRYTHCDIDQAIFGLVTLASPMANNSNATRIAYYTNHRKQSASWPYMNWPYRMDKNITIQHYIERPMISTFSDAFTQPNGQHPIIAMMPYIGEGQEDSLILNQASVDCGLFNASFITYEKAKLEPGEQFGVPDHTKTMDPRKNAVYEYIRGGVIAPGTRIKKNYVLISKYASIVKGGKKNPSAHLYTDKSIVYKLDEEATIMDSFIVTEGEPVAKVQLRMERNAREGDKLSSRHGNKGIIAQLRPREDMPYDENGVVIDGICNPHSIPTRKAVNQIIECVYAILAAALGVSIDATAFREHDIDHNLQLLHAHGVKYGGHRRLYDGRTGEWIDAPIFYGPTTYQRLQKFVTDENYAINTGQVNNVTNQPREGKAHEGGLKYGEMEKDVGVASGAMRSVYEKLYTDSDGVFIYVCRNCKLPAIVNEAADIYKCTTCGDNANIVKVPSSWCANVLFASASNMNNRMLLEIEPQVFVRD